MELHFSALTIQNRERQSRITYKPGKNDDGSSIYIDHTDGSETLIFSKPPDKEPHAAAHRRKNLLGYGYDPGYFDRFNVTAPKAGLAEKDWGKSADVRSSYMRIGDTLRNTLLGNVSIVEAQQAFATLVGKPKSAPWEITIGPGV